MAANCACSAGAIVAGNLALLRRQRASHLRSSSGGANGCWAVLSALLNAIVVSLFGPVPTPWATKKPALSNATRTAVAAE